MESHCFVGKHEPAFIHEEGQLSYDPAVYSSSYQDRFHIKTIDVYRHHCLHQLSEKHRALRSNILYIEQHSDAVQVQQLSCLEGPCLQAKHLIS